MFFFILKTMAKSNDIISKRAVLDKLAWLANYTSDLHLLDKIDEFGEFVNKYIGAEGVTIPAMLYDRLNKLGLIPNEVRDKNVGASDYSEHIIQPWAIWIDWQLNPWDADIVKRVVRHKATDPRRLDYEKIIHICQERIRQIEAEEADV